LWGHHTERHETAGLHGALASGYSLLGNFVLAEHHLSRAISCCDSLNDKRGKVNSLIRMAVVKRRQNAFVEAETILTQALTIARDPIHFRLGEAYALVNLGELALIQKRYSQSLETTENGLTLACQLGDKSLINYALCILSMAYLYVGDMVTATLLLSETDIQTSDKTFSYEYAIHEVANGTILLYKRQYNEAYSCLTSLEKSMNTLQPQREWLQITMRIAACQLALGYTTEATYRLEEMATKVSHDGSSQSALLELSHLSTLEHAIKTMPELEHVRTLLLLEIEAQQTTESLELISSTPRLTTTVIDQPRLRILALGEPRVLLGEKIITNWRMPRAMELFFFLFNCNRPMRKEQIIAALWTESDEQIDQTIYSTVHYLRKALGKSCIVSCKGAYTLDLTSQYGNAIWYDVAKFQEHHIQARQALSREDNSSARTAFCAMIDLYRGDYLQSIYSDWCISRRDELRQDYLEACRQVAQIAWHNKQFDESAIYWRHMLAVDNCMEEAHYGLMRCFLRQGKRGLALRQYQRCRDILQEELAILPGAAIQNLYQHLVVASQH
jgi:Response regulator containing CheY-like receiver and SARP domains